MTYQAEKSAAAIGYLVKKTGADLYSVMKMLYLADKAHVSKYGRTIAGDCYVAMQKGPVPDRAYNLCKYVRGERSHFDPLPNAQDYLRLADNSFSLVAEPNLDELSRSDIEALDQACAIYSHGGWKAVFNNSHDDAWKAAWSEAQARKSGSVTMQLAAIASTLPNGADVIEFMADPHPGEEIGREHST